MRVIYKGFQFKYFPFKAAFAAFFLSSISECSKQSFKKDSVKFSGQPGLAADIQKTEFLLSGFSA